MSAPYAMNTTDPRLPNYTRPEVAEAAEDLRLMHDLLGGTRRMHACSRTYIRQWADELDATYDIRRHCETVFEGFRLALNASVGKLFAVPPAIEWNASEAAIMPHWDNIDGAGTHGVVFSKQFAEQCLLGGYSCVLVDFPTRPDVIVSGHTERVLGLRPTWHRFPRGALINWRTGVVNNEMRPTLLVFQEFAEVDDNEYGVTTVERFLVLRLVKGQATWTRWQKQRSDAQSIADFAVVGSGLIRNAGGQVADFLPVPIGYAGRTDAPLTAEMPLLPVAWSNLAHWQISTDLRFARSVAGFAQPVYKGDPPIDPTTGKHREIGVGPLVAVICSEGGDFVWRGPEVSGLEQLVAGRTEKLEEMARLSVSFLSGEKRAAETAEAKRIDAAAQHSTLSTAAGGIEDALNLAFEHHAWYMGIEKAAAPVLRINRDFERTVLPPEVMEEYTRAAKEIGFDIEELLKAWQIGGRISPDADIPAMAQRMQDRLLAGEIEKEVARQESLQLALSGAQPPTGRAA